MKSSSARFQGFTIVELLIVIVVIGILAALVITTFAGIQKKARNTVRVNTAKQIMNALAAANNVDSTTMSSLIVGNGSFNSACLGYNLPDQDGNGVQDCVSYNGTVLTSVNTTFNTKVAKVAKLPDLKAFPKVVIPGADAIYAPFVYVAPVEEGNIFVMEYPIEGVNENCSLGPIIRYLGGANYSSNAMGQKYSAMYGDNKTTTCIVKLDVDTTGI